MQQQPSTSIIGTGKEILSGLVTRLDLQRQMQADHIIPGTSMRYLNNTLFVDGAKLEKGYNPSDICHDQIAAKLGIPTAYYKRMRLENPDLLESNINSWLSKDEKVKYMLRTFNQPEAHGIARAFLSDRYNILDNYDVLLAALEAIKKMGINVDIKKADVTDKKMYLCVTCPEVEQQATDFLKDYLTHSKDGVGNGIVSGLVISNSEVGMGSFEVRPRAVILKCNNGLVKPDDRFRRIHLGKQLDEGTIQWSERTKQKNYELIISQTQDAIRTFLSPEYLGVMIQSIADAHQIKLERPIDTVQNVCKELSITEEHRKEILSYFLSDGDHNASGVFQAITRQAQNMGADDQFEIEQGAFELLPDIKKFDKPFSKN